MAGPGESDVGQPQLLAPPFDEVLETGAPVLVRPAADVDGAPVAGIGVVEHRRLVLEDPPRIPQVRAVDDGELEALAAVDRQHLHRLGVGLESAAAVLGVVFLAGLVDALAQPAGEGGDAELLGGGGAVQELADVAEVGELALAVDPGQDPAGQPLAMADRLDEGGHAPLAQHRGPPVQAGMDVLPGCLVGGGHLVRGPAEE